MPNPSSLQTLIELSGKKSDEAAKSLGAALRACEEAEAKLRLLVQYRDDYLVRRHSCMEIGISSAQLGNYEAFLGKLELAISGQTRVSSDARQRAEHARLAWIECERKKKSFSALSDRAALEKALALARIEQKDNDEHASRIFSRNDNEDYSA